MTMRVFGVYGSSEKLIEAVRKLRDRGYQALEAYTPYYVEGLADALGRKPSFVPMLSLIIGVIAAICAYVIQWYIEAYLYPINVGARPPYFPLSYVPVTFEVGVLCASLTAFFSALYGAHFTRLYHPVFDIEGFDSATCDKYWLRVDVTADHADEARSQLWELGAERVVSQAEDP